VAWIAPPYARATGLGPAVIGVLALVNAATVVAAQLPIVKAAERCSPIGALSLAGAAWVAACPLAVAAHAGGVTTAIACLALAAVALSSRRSWPTWRPARSARALHGDGRTVVVARPGRGAGARWAAAGGLADAAADRRGGAGGGDDRPPAGLRARAPAGVRSIPQPDA